MTDTFNKIDPSKPVREGEELNIPQLEPYLMDQIEGAAKPLEVEQFPSGFSNLTYLLKMGDKELVLRRPPFGNKVASAHDMGREYKVLSSLHKVYELAPKPLVFCEDEDLIGSPFYVMERCRGVILRQKDPKNKDIPPEVLKGLGISAVDNLTKLHLLDYKSIGLGDLGRPEGYVERQVGGWTKRYLKAKTDDYPEVIEVADWLKENMPESSRSTLLHNDYKFDNLVLDPNDLTKILAVLDWEMCTLGNPLMDLGSTLAYWIQEDDPEELQQFVAGPTNLPGNLNRLEIVERYSNKTSFETDGILFYYVFGIFKLAVIVQQIYFRFSQGFTKDPRFAKLNHVVKSLGRGAAKAIEKDCIS